MFKDLDGHPVLRRDGGHFGRVPFPHTVSFMKSGKVWKENEVRPPVTVHHRPVICDQHEFSCQTETGVLQRIKRNLVEEEGRCRCYGRQRAKT